MGAEVLAREHDQPFCLCVGIGRPHSPLIAPDRFFQMFPLEDIVLAEALPGDVEDCGLTFRQGHTCTKAWGFEKYQRIMAAGGEAMLKRWTQAYLACVAYADHCIGQVLDALWASPHAENTLVVLTSDNGYHMGEKEYLFKNSCWEESCRVPFVWAGPGVAKGVDCATPVSLLDCFPTFVERCGLHPEPHRHGCALPLDGSSLSELLRNPESGADSSAVALSVVGSDEPLDAGQPGKVADQHYSLRSRDYRYILYRNGEEELYDHRNDPFEWHNLIHDPQWRPTADNLRQQLRDTTGR